MSRTGTSPGAAPLALTMGDPAGIGPEIALAVWRQRRELAVPPFLVLGAPDHLRGLAGRLGLDVPVAELDGPEQASTLFDRALPVLPLRLGAPVEPGRPDPANAPAVIEAIERGAALAAAGAAAALVTNPISKAVLYDHGFRHPGHTEFLAEITGAAGAPVMMLASEQLRVVPVTIHLALAEAVATLTEDAIVHCGRTTAAALATDFGVAAPRIAVAGLNPHAGEDGHMGREEIEVIAPAVARLQRAGIAATGPFPADTLFHERARAGYDAVLCMYHDQALIPLKTLDFDGGVNVTLGLPIVRTSPDHGTAFDIAGTGKARPASLIAALKLAAAMAACRARARQPGAVA